MWLGILLLLLGSFSIIDSYKPNPTQYICIDNSTERNQILPSCLPGYVIDIEKVLYESTRDKTCSGITDCQIENRNAFLFACNRKRTCQIDLTKLSFHINTTCGTTIRFFVQYRCLPVIQEQKDYLCDTYTPRRPSLTDINLSCMRNYRLYITKASVGISLKSSQDEFNSKNRLKCNRETETMCIHDVPNGYRQICQSQSKQECKITYNQRPILNNCIEGISSNYSYVEYSCIPDENIIDDLPRIDICSNVTSERITIDRGLLYSSNITLQNSNENILCRKDLLLPRQSRLRLFLLDQSQDSSSELNIQIANQIRILSQQDLIDVNITNSRKDEILQFQWKYYPMTNNGQFLLYFQVDSRISEYAPFDLEFDRKNGEGYGRGKFLLSRTWAIIIGCILGLLLLLLIFILILIILKCRRRRRHRRHSRRYSKTDDDQHQRLNIVDHQMEQPYLDSSAATILPPTVPPRPNSASSTTSSIIMHQMNNGISDRESLIKPLAPPSPSIAQSRPHGDIDNFYEEIKEQQQQTALALGINGSKGDLTNPYLEARKSFFQGQSMVPPIRDHHEDEPRYQQPRTSNPDN